ncbi:MAG: DUF222 domain-containing protein [Acidimicrobiia bacterium]
MRLSELRSAMSEFATRFDPALVSARDAECVLDDAAAIKNMAATVEALAAARVAETAVWRERGDRRAAHDLARRTGTTVGQAKEALETGRKLQDLPGTADAAKKGELSRQQAAAIADAASTDPDAEERFAGNLEVGLAGGVARRVCPHQGQRLRHRGAASSYPRAPLPAQLDRR